MVWNPYERTPAGNLKQPSRQQVVNWVAEAWRLVPRDIIRRSFLRCGISNALDGTEVDECRDEIPDPDEQDELQNDNIGILFDDDEDDDDDDDLDFDGFDDEGDSDVE